MLTVIIPVYKVESTLDRCVKSVVGQTYSQMEIVLVDDGSPDSCPEKCEKWAEQDRRVKVIHKANGGLSSARNAALNVASGEYVTFVDSDDYLDLNTYEKAMARMTDNVDLVEFPIWKFFGSQRQEKLIFENNVYHNAHDYWLKGEAYTHSYACNKVYRRRLFYDVRFPEGRIFEDAFTLPLLLKKTKGIATTSEGMYYYCDNALGITYSANADGLRQLLEAHLRFAPIADENYYSHVLNIQLDVARMTGCKPELNSLKINHPWRKGLKNGAKILLLNVMGLRTMCKVYRLIYLLRRK